MPISVEEYLRTSYEPNAEYIDGFLRPKPMGTTKHGKTQARLSGLLALLGLDVAVELTVRISATRFLVPDVAADVSLADPYPDRPVLLCAEVLSPEDRAGSMLAKCEEYHAWGVPYCWVIDPRLECGWEYHKDGNPQERLNGETLRAGSFEITLSDLFAGL